LHASLRYQLRLPHASVKLILLERTNSLEQRQQKSQDVLSQQLFWALCLMPKLNSIANDFFFRCWKLLPGKKKTFAGASVFTDFLLQLLP